MGPNQTSILIRPPDEYTLRSEGYRGGDVGAAHDATVDIHLDAIIHAGLHPGEDLERHVAHIQLAPSMVAQDEGIDSAVRQGLCVPGALDTLDHDVSWPVGAYPLDVVEREGRIKCAGQQITHSAGRGGQAGERQRLRREQVEPPPGVQGHLGHRGCP